jgi:hypothetical protein
MAEKNQDLETGEPGDQGIRWDQRCKEVEDAILLAKMDASNVALLYDDEKLVKHHLRQASQQLTFVITEPDKREEHIRAGFDYVGKVRGILGESAVQSYSFRRYQWPFLPPGMD